MSMKKRKLKEAGSNLSENKLRSESSEDLPHETTSGEKKQLSFKEWARQQLQISKQTEPDDEKVSLREIAAASSVENYHPSIEDTRAVQHSGTTGPLGEILSIPSNSLLKRNHVAPIIMKSVTVNRDQKIQAERLLLPIVSEEQAIVETVLIHPVVIICGETGSGKTTQLPQFLYEAGFGSQGSGVFLFPCILKLPFIQAKLENPGIIGITQPRRVAAMSTASRVAVELGLASSRVAYQIRYDATVSPSTIIKFMTDGVLLRELTTDFLLSKYSIIIIDEAHERSMNTDILIGALSRIVKLRQSMWEQKKEGIKPLRLIIMSATLRVDDFISNTTLFSVPPPVINISARQYPVTTHFSRHTSADYISEAVRKVSQIHTKLPPGGILVFLTGQNEIIGVCRKLQARFGRKLKGGPSEKPTVPKNIGPAESPFSAIQDNSETMWIPLADVEAEEIELGDGALDVDLNIDLEDESDDVRDPDDSMTDIEEMPMHVIPLYSLLPSEKQLEVFKEPPARSRLVVVATNIAETSLTIPNIRYVVDCGRAKERKYDSRSGIESFSVSWISKAAAAQRSGRAGRTGPGHCYRLYSSALYENYFDEFAQPEILRVPIEGVVLQMKAMNIDTVINFPFPTPPDRDNLKRAERVLINLGALEDKGNGLTSITNLGKAMAIFPLSPRFSKVLVSAKQNQCLPFAIAIVSALSIGDPFIRPEHFSTSENQQGTGKDEAGVGKPRLGAFYASQQLHGSLGGGISDVFRYLSVVGAYEFAGEDSDFCMEHFVRPKAMEEIHKLRIQLSNIIQINFPEIGVGTLKLNKPPDPTQASHFFSVQVLSLSTPPQLRVLRQLLAAAFIDQVAVRKDIVDNSSSDGNKYTSCRNVPYKALGVSDDVFIHPSSILYNSPPPDFIVFHEMSKTTQTWLKTNTIINPAWLPKLAPSLCSTSKRVKTFDGKVLIVPRFGPELWELPAIREAENK
ncbi:hypothetical protein Clacol_002026 [Clathrus columnatus]|uniref:RNA helicase n=1 Tax=Clathrus columnatus TaxID=1419009 RepID=A0AAV5A5E4_9AGAM|nr:hypothetical protein Clacol_002026 [Clathrus columnatus]